MCGAGWLDLAAPSDLGDLPSDLARPAWPNLASTGSIWLAWASWPARFGCPGCSWALWLARSGYQRKPQRLAFRLPASFVPARSVCIVSSCIVSSTIYWIWAGPSMKSSRANLLFSDQKRHNNNCYFFFRFFSILKGKIP